MAENELPNQGDDINQSGSFGVGVNKGNINVYPSKNHLTPQEYRNRQALLAKVNNFWVKGVLEKSLHNQILIELGLEERPDAITNSWNAVLETGENSPQPLPQGTKIIDVFDDIGAGRTLLILGEPGSGKTTTLLELTRDLIARAQQDTKQLIPVVFNLSSWAKKRQKLEDWLIEELGNKYDVPKKIRQSLVKEQQLLPLLDGLDEVKAEYRDDCLIAINKFKQEYGSELVVCSRIKDYQALSHRLNFQSAVCIKLLSREQICIYLDSLGANLTGLSKLVVEDEVWQGLAESPLMLNIMALAYQEVAIEDLPKNDSLEERRKQLFNAYVEQVFKRRKANQLYTNKQVIHWLVWLAQKMVQESKIFFFIEKIQPYWLEKRKQKGTYILISRLSLGLSLGLSFGLLFGLLFRLDSGLDSGLDYGFGLGLGLSFGLPIGILIALLSKLDKEIKTFEKLQFNWRQIKLKKLQFNWRQIKLEKLIFGLIFALIFGLIYSVTEGLDLGLIEVLIVGLIGVTIVGLFFGLIGVLIFGLTEGLNSSEIEIKTSPNQGIWASVLNSITLLLIVGLSFGLIGVPIVGLSFELILVLITGLIFGLGFGLDNGGKACIQHFSLRLILYCNNYIPWNYARFLDYAADRILLQKVGGGYIFIHRMLMEHFAEMSLD